MVFNLWYRSSLILRRLFLRVSCQLINNKIPNPQLLLVDLNLLLDTECIGNFVGLWEFKNELKAISLLSSPVLTSWDYPSPCILSLSWCFFKRKQNNADKIRGKCRWCQHEETELWGHWSWTLMGRKWGELFLEKWGQSWGYQLQNSLQFQWVEIRL